jgi:hypothetical protein
MRLERQNRAELLGMTGFLLSVLFILSILVK